MAKRDRVERCESPQEARLAEATMQYREFMACFRAFVSDSEAAEWSKQESISGVPKLSVSGRGYAFYFTVFIRSINNGLDVKFFLRFEAGLSEMCRTEVMCFYIFREVESQGERHEQERVLRAAQKVNLTGLPPKIRSTRYESFRTLA